MRNKIMKVVLLVLIILTGKALVAQHGPDSLEYVPAQITFVPPLSTMGPGGPNSLVNFSFNILAGYSGALEGLEWSGLVGIQRYYYKGAQFAGFANVAGGDGNGIQGAGFSNIIAGKCTGIQAAGFFNYAGDSTRALQASGGINIVTGSFSGPQLGGLINVVTGEVSGLQAAGVVNLVTNDVQGAQLAGVINTVTDSIDGFQVSGVLNFGNKVKGTQLGGVLNIASEIEGTQIGGVVNIAGKVKGFQLAPFNFADTVDGISIGFFSFVNKGYHKLELSGNELFYGNISIRTGVRRFYNIFSAGASVKDNSFLFGAGYGFGSEIPLGKKVGINTDLVGYSLNRDFYWDDLNFLGRGNLTLTWHAGKKFEIFAGPSLNVLVRYDILKDGLYEDVAPYYFYDRNTSWNSNVKMWAGGNFGFRFF